MIKVGVIGALGKMGKEVVKAILNAEDTELVMAVDIVGAGQEVAPNIKIETDLKVALQTKKPDVVIDFTQPSGIFDHVCLYMQEKVKSVIGTTGLKEEQIEKLKELFLIQKNLEKFRKILDI